MTRKDSKTCGSRQTRPYARTVTHACACCSSNTSYRYHFAFALLYNIRMFRVHAAIIFSVPTLLHRVHKMNL